MANRFSELFAEHRSAAIPMLWPWQEELLDVFPEVSDAAIELPTGTGKTLVALLIGEQHRRAGNRKVAYLAGTKQLAKQVERHAKDLRLPVVRFQGSKDSWRSGDVRSYNFGEALGVMNYWNYFNASPGVEAADLLILDDAHLMEGPLRDMYTVTVRSDDDLYSRILERIRERCPYYSIAGDLLNGVLSPLPPEMLAFPDSLDMSDEVRDLIDASIPNGTPQWWAWQRIRDRLGVCCWLMSRRAVTFTPFIPPSQTLPHFRSPSRRLYLSATIGDVDDLRRRLGAPPLTKLTSQVQPEQGERFVLLGDSLVPNEPAELVDFLDPILSVTGKALWLCARSATSEAIVEALEVARQNETVRVLEQDNGADELFAAEDSGHLVMAGRYDGMDFPGDACRLEILPEIPVATSELEEWASAYLRDAPFADGRFAQRVVQALGRCNRQEGDRAVYLLADPEFATRLSRRSVIDQLPAHVYSDVRDALDRSDDGFWPGAERASQFLHGETTGSAVREKQPEYGLVLGDASPEVDGFHALWRQDHGGAAKHFDDAAEAASMSAEYRSFWLAMRALALQEAGMLGDTSAPTIALTALRAAATAGATSTFFTRLRLSEHRRAGEATIDTNEDSEELFSTWDRLISRLGAEGPGFDRWCAKLHDEIVGGTHDQVARAVQRFGSDVLGLAASVPKPTSGEHDVHWEFARPHRYVAFEVKLAPESKRVVNSDVNQAEGAVRALAERSGLDVVGVLLSPWEGADKSAIDRLERVRLLNTEVMAAYVDGVLAVVREYRRGWARESGVRSARRDAVRARLPKTDRLIDSHAADHPWMQPIRHTA